MIIIDAGALVSQCAGFLRDYTRLDDNMRLEMIRKLVVRSIISWVNPNVERFGNNIIIANDKGYSQGGGYWRNKINPYYKKSRKTKSNPDLLSIFKNLSIVKKEIKDILPFNFIEIEGIEADDIIATLVIDSFNNKNNSDWVENLKQEEILIISHDHDMEQLLEYPDVSIYSCSKNKFLKVTPKEIRDLKIEHIIKGDPGDSICNILSDEDTLVTEGKRQKSLSKKLLDEYKENFNDTLLRYPEYKERIERNIQMVIMKKIPENIQSDIIKEYNNEIKRVKERELIFTYFGSNGLMDQINQINKFF